ncbi:MAG: hypothetical protein KAX20_03790 [Candidatus Omnitrophica bacterium]|nr:hypothetical protein [Candidatus Omnitrophota bacterium]
MQKKWEYDVTVFDIYEAATGAVSDAFSASEFLRAIGDRGEKGWELVTISTFMLSGTTLKAAFFWKREKPDAQKSKELTNQS